MKTKTWTFIGNRCLAAVAAAYPKRYRDQIMETSPVQAERKTNMTLRLPEISISTAIVACGVARPNRTTAWQCRAPAAEWIRPFTIWHHAR